MPICRLGKCQNCGVYAFSVTFRSLYLSNGHLPSLRIFPAGIPKKSHKNHPTEIRKKVICTYLTGVLNDPRDNLRSSTSWEIYQVVTKVKSCINFSPTSKNILKFLIYIHKHFIYSNSFMNKLNNIFLQIVSYLYV